MNALENALKKITRLKNNKSTEPLFHAYMAFLDAYLSRVKGKKKAKDYFYGTKSSFRTRKKVNPHFRTMGTLHG